MCWSYTDRESTRKKASLWRKVSSLTREIGTYCIKSKNSELGREPSSYLHLCEESRILGLVVLVRIMPAGQGIRKWLISGVRKTPKEEGVAAHSEQCLEVQTREEPPWAIGPQGLKESDITEATKQAHTQDLQQYYWKLMLIISFDVGDGVQAVISNSKKIPMAT